MTLTLSPAPDPHSRLPPLTLTRTCTRTRTRTLNSDPTQGAAEKFNFSFLDYFKKVRPPSLAPSLPTATATATATTLPATAFASSPPPTPHQVMGPYLALRFFLMPAPLLLFGRAFYTNALINIALADVRSPAEPEPL